MVTWQDPPDRKNRGICWTSESSELRQNPGRWALLTTKPTPRAAWSTVWAINTGHLTAFRPAGHFEAYSRGTDVYARYLGEGQLP
jgi:hypothetical protein